MVLRVRVPSVFGTRNRLSSWVGSHLFLHVTICLAFPQSVLVRRSEAHALNSKNESVGNSFQSFFLKEKGLVCVF
jgi:hypothetical protein